MGHDFTTNYIEDERKQAEVRAVLAPILEHIPGWHIDEELSRIELDGTPNKIVLVRDDGNLMVGLGAYYWDYDEENDRPEKRRIQGFGVIPDEDFRIAVAPKVHMTFRMNRKPAVLAKDIGRRLLVPHEAKLEESLEYHAKMVELRKERFALVSGVAEALGLPIPKNNGDPDGAEKKEFLTGRVGNDWISAVSIREGDVVIQASLAGDHQLILASLTALREVLDIRSVSQEERAHHYMPWEMAKIVDRQKNAA